MLEATPWLPPALPGDVERAICAFAQPWYLRWFGSGGHCRTETSSADHAPDMDWRGCNGAATGVDAAMLWAIADAILGSQCDPGNARDSALLENVGRRAIDDLAGELCGISGADRVAAIDGTPPGTASYRLLCSQARWSFILRIDPVTSIRLRQRQAGPQCRPRLSTLSAAISSEHVRLGCHLGRAVLTAADLAELAQGDLLVLDSRLGSDLPLTVEMKATATGTARIGSDQDNLSIEIVEPPEFLPMHAETP